MKSPVTDEMIQYITRITLKVLPSGNRDSHHHHQQNQNACAYPSPPNSPSQEKETLRLPSLRTFITKLVRYTNVYTPTLLTTICYLNRLKRILPQDARGLPSTTHRLFLACLILSAKFHNDSSPLNRHWARYTDGLFTLEDVNLMERQLLQLLGWDLRVSQEDLVLDLQHLLEPIRNHVIGVRQTLGKRQQQHHTNKLQTNKLQTTRNVSVSSNLSTATLVN